MGMFGLIVLGLIGVITLIVLGFLVLLIIPFIFALIPAVIVDAILGVVSGLSWVAGLVRFIIIGAASLLKTILHALF